MILLESSENSHVARNNALSFLGQNPSYSQEPPSDISFATEKRTTSSIETLSPLPCPKVQLPQASESRIELGVTYSNTSSPLISHEQENNEHSNTRERHSKDKTTSSIVKTVATVLEQGNSFHEFNTTSQMNLDNTDDLQLPYDPETGLGNTPSQYEVLTLSINQASVTEALDRSGNDNSRPKPLDTVSFIQAEAASPNNITIVNDAENVMSAYAPKALNMTSVDNLISHNPFDIIPSDNDNPNLLIASRHLYKLRHLPLITLQLIMTLKTLCRHTRL